MKFLGGLQSHYEAGSTTIAHALKITRPDGAVFGFTSHIEPVTIEGVYYDARQGLDVSGIAHSGGLEVDNLELTTVDDGSFFDRAEILANVWQNSRFLLFAYNYTNPAQGFDYKLAGTVGGVRLLRGAITMEFRGLQQYFQQPVGVVTSKTCRARFADFPEANPQARCRLDPAAYTDSLLVGMASDLRTFTVTPVTGAARPSGYFAGGIVTWTAGQNAGLRAKVRAYEASPALIELVSDMPHPIQPGDTLQALAGCQKRREDCVAFGNILNFQGEPDLIGIDALTAPPGVL